MTEDSRRQYVQAVAVTLYPQHIAVMDSHAKDAGMNRSEALRSIIDEWTRLKARESGVKVEG